MKNYTETGDYVAAQKLELASRNLQHLLKIQEEQTSLEAIVNSLQQTIIDAHASNPDDFEDILAAQVRILDATFHYYVDAAKDRTYTRDDKINLALKAQRQTQHSIMAWSRLKYPKTKKSTERTRQNAPLDT